MLEFTNRLQFHEDRIHNPCGSQNLVMGDRVRSAICDSPVERFYQILHAGLHMEIARCEQPEVREKTLQILVRHDHGRHECFGVALELLAPKHDQRLLILIQNEAVLRAINTELMQ